MAEIETYHRLHTGTGNLAFSPENAWSAPWGETFSADGTQYECRECDGTGEAFGEPCSAGCDNGYLDADPGYSCCTSATELLAYFDQHNPAADGSPVVVFQGDRVGTGTDGEPLTIPTTVMRWTTIGQLRKQLA